MLDIDSDIKRKSEWRTSDGAQCLMEGDSVLWRNKVQSKIELEDNDSRISSMQDGQIYKGEVKGDKIQWDDGDVWVRTDINNNPIEKRDPQENDEDNSDSESTVDPACTLQNPATIEMAARTPLE
eukprot:UN01465